MSELAFPTTMLILACEPLKNVSAPTYICGHLCLLITTAELHSVFPRSEKTYTTSDDGWVLAGTYKEKNVRGMQARVSPQYSNLAIDQGVFPYANYPAWFLQVHPDRLSLTLWT